MADQYIVAVHTDGTLNVTAVGPFRSEKKARDAQARIDAAAEWTSDPDTYWTVTAQVVRLSSLDDVLATVAPPAEQTGGGRG